MAESPLSDQQQTPYTSLLSPEKDSLFRQKKSEDFVLIDPFSWSYQARAAVIGVIGWTVSWVPYQRWYKRPWFSHLPLYFGGALASSFVMYNLGRFHNYSLSTRDAIVEHYMRLHPEEFDHLQINTGNDRKFKDLMMPWYPVRAYETVPRKATVLD